MVIKASLKRRLGAKERLETEASNSPCPRGRRASVGRRRATPWGRIGLWRRRVATAGQTEERSYEEGKRSCEGGERRLRESGGGCTGMEGERRWLRRSGGRATAEGVAAAVLLHGSGCRLRF